jgi:membrane protease subunit HflC
MGAGKFFAAFFVVILLLTGLMSVFVVKETERALMLRFGKVISDQFEPGLHFKIPIVHQVRFFDKRIQTIDAPPALFLTNEKKNLIVNSFIKWRLIDVVTYFKTVGGNPQRAGQRLAEIIADGLRSEFGKRTIKEVVSGDRAEIMDLITEEADVRAQQFGIKIVDVRIKQIELPKEVSTSVYERMRAERERDAKQLRSQGEAQAQRIRAAADREAVEIIALAERDAQQIRGQGDAIAADTFAKAFSQDAEFYVLYRSLNAYKRTFNSRSDLLLLQPDSEFFSYFKQINQSMSPATRFELTEKTEKIVSPKESETLENHSTQ